MNANLKSTSIPQSNQTSTDSGFVVRGTDSQSPVKAPTFHVQTGIRAGTSRGELRTFIREEAEIR